MQSVQIVIVVGNTIPVNAYFLGIPTVLINDLSVERPIEGIYSTMIEQLPNALKLAKDCKINTTIPNASWSTICVDKINNILLSL